MMRRMARALVAWYKTFVWEALAWFAGLAFLALSNPYDPTHLSFFPPTWLFGLRSPGYNLGHSIAYIFHGRFMQSLQANPLGIVAVAVLAGRIITLVHTSYKKYLQEKEK
jgi:hypothetical protein